MAHCLYVQTEFCHSCIVMSILLFQHQRRRRRRKQNGSRQPNYLLMDVRWKKNIKTQVSRQRPVKQDVWLMVEMQSTFQIGGDRVSVGCAKEHQHHLGVQQQVGLDTMWHKQNYSMVMADCWKFEGEVCLSKQFMVNTTFTINCLQNYTTKLLAQQRKIPNCHHQLNCFKTKYCCYWKIKFV